MLIVINSLAEIAYILKIQQSISNSGRQKNFKNLTRSQNNVLDCTFCYKKQLLKSANIYT